jgi:AcrR family transcriptional regulator
VNAPPDPVADGELDDDELRAADGRVPGRRGRATRQKLLDCTRGMLGSESYRDLRVVDIARSAVTSPANYYQYVPDGTSAVAALAEEMAEQGNEIVVDLVKRGSWRGQAGWETALAIAKGYVTLWEDNWPLMRVLDLTAAEGDQRFRSIRVHLLNQVTVALSDVISAQQVAGRQVDSIDPMATAGVLVSMLAHVAAHRYGFEFYGIRTADLEVSMAHILYTTVTGQKPPKQRA